MLLSREFRDTHCFGLRRELVGDERMLGVTFRPRGGRAVVEIEGTMWLHEESAERRLVGGDLTFGRLPDGPNRLGPAGLSTRPQTVLAGYRQTGGTVTDAFVGGVPFEAGDGVVAGIVRDSLSGAPLPGADIVLRDWDDAAAFLPRPDPADTPFSAVTDAAGAFRVANLPDGVYALGLDHPRLRTAGVRLNERRVVVDDRTSEPVELWAPSSETLYARICPGSTSSDGRGAVVGIARNADTGLPVPGIEIEALWRVRRFHAAGVSEQNALVVWRAVPVASGQSVDGRRDFR